MNEEVECQGCGTHFKADRGQVPALDLRPVSPALVSFTIDIGAAVPEVEPEQLHRNPSPTVDFGSTPAPVHIGADLMSWIPAPSDPGALVLDLGCGSCPNMSMLKAAGYTYVPVDYSNPEAMMLCDAHALPFADATFDFVISIAVLEHLHSPALAMSEVRRVLKPGRSMLGSVAFLEPYHSRSYYHHTQLGLANSLFQAGLAPRHIWVTPNWTLFQAQAKSLYRGAPKLLGNLLTRAGSAAHALWWRIGRFRHPSAFSPVRRDASAAAAWMFLADSPLEDDAPATTATL